MNFNENYTAAGLNQIVSLDDKNKISICDISLNYLFF